MMELTEDFLKLLQIAIIVVGVLAIYFSYVSYNIVVDSRSAEREATVFGNALLSSSCLIYSDTKSLFSEDKLNRAQSDPSCLKKYYPEGVVTVKLQDSTGNWQINIGTASANIESTFNVAVILSSGIVKPGLMVVKV